MVKVQRQQFRFLPAYAITVNASQGRTLKSAIIHLDGKYTDNSKAYVMLSRLTNGLSLGIIGTWDKSLFRTKPNGLMLAFMTTYLIPSEERTLALCINLPEVLLEKEELLKPNH